MENSGDFGGTFNDPKCESQSWANQATNKVRRVGEQPDDAIMAVVGSNQTRPEAVPVTPRRVSEPALNTPATPPETVSTRVQDVLDTVSTLPATPPEEESECTRTVLYAVFCHRLKPEEALAAGECDAEPVSSAPTMPDAVYLRRLEFLTLTGENMLQCDPGRLHEHAVCLQ